MKNALRTALVASLTVFLLPCILPDVASCAMAIDNPVSLYMPVSYIYNATEYHYDRWFWGRAWVITNTGWDGCRTEEGRTFNHIHGYDTGFPFNDGVHHDPPLTVTADMCNDFCDAAYGDDFTRSSNATCKSNCHGYATGYGTIIEGEPYGIGRILADDYRIVDWSPFEGEGMFCNYDHSILVTFYGCNAPDPDDWGKVKSRSEKSNASGIYGISYYPESGPEPGDMGALWVEDWP